MADGEGQDSGKVTLQTSPHFEEYVALMEAGWSSIALERYASYRFGETLPSSVFRQYKHRHGVHAKPSVLVGDTPVSQIDVMSVREELVALQLQRIAIDVRHEQQMSKLFNTVGREIDLLSRLLDKVKTDQQDYGILPKADGAPVTVNVNGQPEQRATLREVLGLESDDDVIRAAEALAQVIQFPDAAGA